MKKVLIIGAGPAGLTAAWELLRQEGEYEVTVLEESDTFGGISRTVCHHGNRMDMGGHRFFSKVPEVNAWWQEMLPAQGAPARDDRMLGRDVQLSPGGPDPEKTDEVMLRRNRLSRIFFNGKFFDYPISMRMETIRNMGFLTTAKAGTSYLASALHKRQENSLEDFYINRFGRKLYSMFFENYTENLWGRHPSVISPEWGAQRVKGLSITAIIRDMAGKALHKSNRKVETSLIEEFLYPKLGPGQLWELTARKVEEKGGKILRNARVTAVHLDAEGRAESLTWEDGEGRHEEKGDFIISSMPLKDLVGGMNDVPEEIAAIAAGLPYRDYMTVGVLLPSECLLLKNETSIRTVGNIVPDDWVYVHDRNVHMGRFQVYNNWSPYLVKDPEHTVWMGLEYFCNEGDSMWSMTDRDFAHMAIAEMKQIRLIRHLADVKDYHVERVKKAYPAYFDTYAQIDELRRWLDQIPNLYCVGRNGQHRYNNLDHSMCTSFEAVKAIRSGTTDKSAIWSVNTEQEYHEKAEQ